MRCYQKTCEKKVEEERGKEEDGSIMALLPPTMDKHSENWLEEASAKPGNTSVMSL